MCGIHPKVQKYGKQIIDEVKLCRKITTDFKDYKLIVTDFEINVNKTMWETQKILYDIILKTSKLVKKKNYYGTLIVPENTEFSDNGRFLLHYYTSKIMNDLTEMTDKCGYSGYDYFHNFKEFKGMGDLQFPKLKIITFFKK